MIRLETQRLYLCNNLQEVNSKEDFEKEILLSKGLINSELGDYFAVFKLTLKDDDSFIGCCKLLPRYFTSKETWIINTQWDRAKWPGSVNVEIGWNILKKYQNMGFATEAAKGIIEYAFNTLQLSKVVAVTDINNIPSMKIMESISMHVKIAPNSSLAYGVAYNNKY